MVLSVASAGIGSMKPVFHKAVGFAMVVALSSCASTMVNAMAIPERMQLTETMKSADLGKANLIPIDFTVGVQEMEPVTGEEAINTNTDNIGSIAFVVRRPG